MPRTRRLKGTGSLYKSDGRYIVQMPLGTVDGKRKSKKWVFHSLSDAQRKLRQLQNAGSYAKVPTVAAYLAAALEARQHQLRPKTARSYSRTVDLHIVPYLGHLPVNHLTPQALEDWLKQLRLKRRGTATIRYSRVVLRTLLRGAQRAGWIAVNPASLVEPPKHTRKAIVPLSPAQAGTLLQAVAGHWLAPLVLLMLACGLRLGEALGLQWQDVQNGRLVIRRTLQRVHVKGPRKTALLVAEPKTASSRRTLTLPASLSEALDKVRTEYAPLRSPWVFCNTKGGPLEPRNVSRAWYALRAKAGLPEVRIHDLRHSAASFALVLGLQPRVVADMLGHSDLRMLDVYQHVLPALRDGVAEKIDGLLQAMQPKVE